MKIPWRSPTTAIELGTIISYNSLTDVYQVSRAGRGVHTARSISSGVEVAYSPKSLVALCQTTGGGWLILGTVGRVGSSQNIDPSNDFVDIPVTGPAYNGAYDSDGPVRNGPREGTKRVYVNSGDRGLMSVISRAVERALVWVYAAGDVLIKSYSGLFVLLSREYGELFIRAPKMRCEAGGLRVDSLVDDNRNASVISRSFYNLNTAPSSPDRFRFEGDLGNQEYTSRKEEFNLPNTNIQAGVVEIFGQAATVEYSSDMLVFTVPGNGANSRIVVTPTGVTVSRGESSVAISDNLLEISGASITIKADNDITLICKNGVDIRTTA